MAGSIYSWDTTAANNATADATINWAEGQLPGTVNDSARALMAAYASQNKDLGGTISTTGSANAYLLTLNCGFTSLATGQRAVFKASFTNSAAATIAVNSLAAKALRKWTGAGDTALVAGDIQSGGLYHIIYDSAANAAAGAWIVVNLTLPTDAAFTNITATGGISTVNLAASNAFTLVGTTMTAVTGTGNIVLSASPTLTGTLTAAAATFSGVVTHSSTTTLSGALTYGGVALSNAVTGTGNMVLSAGQTLTGTTTAARIDLPAGPTKLNVGGTGQGTNSALSFRFNSGSASAIEISTSDSGVAGSILTIMSSADAIVSTWVFTAAQAGITISGNYKFTTPLVLSAAGSAGSPTLVFSNAGTNCGIYTIGANDFGVSVNGSSVCEFTAGRTTVAAFATTAPVGIATAPISTTWMKFAAAAAANSQINLSVGGPPTSPLDGDIWLESNTNTGLKIRIAGVTKTVTVS
jgi:hypothetical protein